MVVVYMDVKARLLAKKKNYPEAVGICLWRRITKQVG